MSRRRPFSRRGRRRCRRMRRRCEPATISTSSSAAPAFTAWRPARATPSRSIRPIHRFSIRLLLWGAGRVSSDMPSEHPLKIGITCYPSIGGSGILASALGEELAARGHEVHFISYERPFRLPSGVPRLHFHPVAISGYGLFKYPDYTLPLSVKMAEVSRDHRLDVLHVHYAGPQ